MNFSIETRNKAKNKRSKVNQTNVVLKSFEIECGRADTCNNFLWNFVEMVFLLKQEKEKKKCIADQPKNCHHIKIFGDTVLRSITL